MGGSPACHPIFAIYLWLVLFQHWTSDALCPQLVGRIARLNCKMGIIFPLSRETGVSPQIGHLLYDCGYPLCNMNVDRSENIKSSVTGS